MSDSPSERPSERPAVVLLCSDLMLTSSVSGAAAARGIRFVTATVADAATLVSEIISDGTRCRLFVDLATPGLDVPALARMIPPDVLQGAVAYGPHVHESRLEQARTAGFGQVVSRGAFHARFMEWL